MLQKNRIIKQNKLKYMEFSPKMTQYHNNPKSLKKYMLKSSSNYCI